MLADHLPAEKVRRASVGRTAAAGRTAMDRIERLAELSILRALGFVALAIATVMVGMSFEAALCFQTGAILAVMTAIVLAFRAWEAPRRNVKHTEVYMMVDGDFGMPLERAQDHVGAVLRRLYTRFARITAGFAAFFWLVSVTVRLT